jgi:hypothetical protein
MKPIIIGHAMGNMVRTIQINNAAAAVFTSFAKKFTAPLKTEFEGHDIIALWGDDNLHPQNAYAVAKLNSTIPSTIAFKAEALYGNGLFYGEVTIDEETGEEVFARRIDPQWEAFLASRNTKQYIMKACLDYYWHGIVFPEMVQNTEKTKILAIKAQEAQFCRWGLQNLNNGLIDKCYISADWGLVTSLDPKYVTVVPVLDVSMDGTEALRTAKYAKFIYPTILLSQGKTYYPDVAWESIIGSKWLDVAQAIPAFKKAMMENQMTVKYIIKIPDYWWSWKYEGFDDIEDQATRDKLVEEAIDEFNTFLTGIDNAGKSIVTTFKTDVYAKERYAGIEIEPIASAFKEGMYVEDSQEATAHILYALGVPTALLGTVSNKIGAGSGSNIRENYNVYLSRTKMHEDVILEPFAFIGEYNGWPKREFRFRKSMLRTLNEINPSDRNGDI